MHWNYRIIRKEWLCRNGKSKNFSHSVHECFYDENGVIYAFTEEPVSFGDDFCDNDTDAVKSILRGLNYAIEDIERSPVLDYELLLKPDLDEKHYNKVDEYICNVCNYDAFDDYACRPKISFGDPNNTVGFVWDIIDLPGDASVAQAFEQDQEYQKLEDEICTYIDPFDALCVEDDPFGDLFGE